MIFRKKLFKQEIVQILANNFVGKPILIKLQQYFVKIAGLLGDILLANSHKLNNHEFHSSHSYFCGYNKITLYLTNVKGGIKKVVLFKNAI